MNSSPNLSISINFSISISPILPQAVKQFIDLINSSSSDPNRKAVTPAIATKFLLARKFDIPRAVALYEQHELIRQREELYGFDPLNDPLRTELETGKFTMLVSVFFLCSYVCMCEAYAESFSAP